MRLFLRVLSLPRSCSAPICGLLLLGSGGRLAAQTNYTTPYAITTLAGTSGVVGYVDATGPAAQFYGVYGIVADKNGNLFVADNSNNAIRMVTPAGKVTTLAGNPNSLTIASIDGTGVAAQFAGPFGIAIDNSSGNLYVTDSGSNTIRKVTPAGVVTTLAGLAGARGFADGTGSLARFNQPTGIAVDGSGNIFVADATNSLIREITPGGKVTTFAGTGGQPGSADGTGPAARFTVPAGLAFDASGNLYVADSSNHAIREINSAGVVTTIAGKAGSPGSTDGVGAAARFNSPFGLAVDPAGNVFVADTFNSTVRKIAPGGVVSTIAGKPGVLGATNGIGPTALFGYLLDVALDASGNLYVTDAAALIRKGALSAPNLLTNGSFETLTGFTANSGNDTTTLNPGDLSMTGWRVVSNQVAWIGPTNPFGASAEDGGYFLDLTSYGDVSPYGGVEQTVTTVPGTTYDLSFWLGTRVGSLATITASATGSAAVQFSASAAFWQRCDYYFSATAATTTIDLVGLTAGSDLIGLDNVSLSTGGPASIITQQTGDLTISPGSTVTFTVTTATTAGLSYQWEWNGTALTNGGNLSGATGAQLLILNAPATDAGVYVCVVTSAAGSTSTKPAHLSFANSVNLGRLVNLSVLTTAGTGSQPFTVGFFTGGAGTSGQQTLLIRGDGPALTAFGVGSVLADPVIKLFQSSNSSLVGTNDNWGTNSAAVIAADAATFAFPLTAGSLDAAMVSTLAPGGYSVQVTGNGNGVGNAIAEVYDDTATYTASSTRLYNLSCLAQINAGAILTAGFVVGGTTAKTVLVRVTGPALNALGVTGTMPDPQLTLHQSVSGQDTVLAANASWGGNPQITLADSVVYAFPLTNANSADSAFLITLPPGNYSAQATSTSGAAGTALVEVYEIP